MGDDMDEDITRVSTRRAAVSAGARPPACTTR